MNRIGKREKAMTLATSLLYVAAVLFLCFASATFFSQYDVDLGGSFLGIRKDHWAHFLMFFPYPFFFFLMTVCFFLDSFVFKYLTALSVVSGILFSGATELVQLYLIPDRMGEYADFIADASAIIIGSIIVSLFKLKRLK